MAQDRENGAIAQQPNLLYRTCVICFRRNSGNEKLELPAPEQKEETELTGTKKYDKGHRELGLTLRHKKLTARAPSQLL